MLHLVQPRLDPTWRFVSEYALGPDGGLVTAAFVSQTQPGQHRRSGTADHDRRQVTDQPGQLAGSSSRG
jgi:hypothetical protein